jgi:hypothetical protein
VVAIFAPLTRRPRLNCPFSGHFGNSPAQPMPSDNLADSRNGHFAVLLVMIFYAMTILTFFWS